MFIIWILKTSTLIHVWNAVLKTFVKKSQQFRDNSIVHTS